MSSDEIEQEGVEEGVEEGDQMQMLAFHVVKGENGDLSHTVRALGFEADWLATPFETDDGSVIDSKADFIRWLPSINKDRNSKQKAMAKLPSTLRAEWPGPYLGGDDVFPLNGTSLENAVREHDQRIDASLIALVDSSSQDNLFYTTFTAYEVSMNTPSELNSMTRKRTSEDRDNGRAVGNGGYSLEKRGWCAYPGNYSMASIWSTVMPLVCKHMNLMETNTARVVILFASREHTPQPTKQACCCLL